MRGIYVNTGDDIDATVMKRAVRIARYLYPRAYLSAASAVLLGRRATAGSSSAAAASSSRLRALKIIQNAAPDYPSVAPAKIDDEMVNSRSASRRHASVSWMPSAPQAKTVASIDEGMRAAIAQRVMEEYGCAQAAADAVWALARENQRYAKAKRPSASCCAVRKNLALLKISEAGSDYFASVRVAPLHDAVTTRVFPRLARDRMALKLNGKDGRLRRADFKVLAVTTGLRAADADAAIDDLTTRLAGALEVTAPPPLVAADSPAGKGGGTDETDRQREDRVAVTGVQSSLKPRRPTAIPATYRRPAMSRFDRRCSSTPTRALTVGPNFIPKYASAYNTGLFRLAYYLLYTRARILHFYARSRMRHLEAPNDRPDCPNEKQLGAILRRIPKQAGLTQAAFGNHIHLLQGTVSRLEGGSLNALEVLDWKIGWHWLLRMKPELESMAEDN